MDNTKSIAQNISDLSDKFANKKTIPSPTEMLVALGELKAEIKKKEKELKFKVELGIPDTEFIFNTLEEAKRFASDEQTASGFKARIIEFKIILNL